MDQVQQMLPANFLSVITSAKVCDNGDIHFQLRVECGAKDFETWLKEFENMTRTNYTVKKNSIKGTIYERSLYATCHHNTHGKLYSETEYKYGSKNTQCPATIQMKKRRPILDDDNSQTLISVNFAHNHPILAADSLRFRKPSKGVEDSFLRLFQSGHTPASAIQAHNLNLILDNPDNYEMLLADNSQSPNYQWVSRLYKKVADSTYGSSKLSNKQQAELIAKLALEKNCSCKIVEDGDQQAIVLISQMMLRISCMPEVGEMCFVDSSGNVDRDGTRFFIFLGKCHAGGVPLAVVLTTSESQSILTHAFISLRELLPAHAFGSSNEIGPQVFITDDCSAERNALREVWPNAVLLLCIFHVLQALWRWLFDRKHNIELVDRRHLLSLFKKLMYADTREQLDEILENVLHDSCFQKYKNFQTHILGLYERRAEWALCYRDHLLIRGQNTNNICESAMMIMKDYVLQRVKAYNIVQLADFVITRLDLYFEQKILKVAFNRLSNSLLCKQACLKRNVDFARDRIIEEGDNIFSVPSEKDLSKTYMVNMELAVCECPVGKDGGLCKHQLAVVKFKGVINTNILPVHDPEQKQYLYFIATGKKKELEFFRSLRDEDETALNIIVRSSSSKTDCTEIGDSCNSNNNLDYEEVKIHGSDADKVEPTPEMILTEAENNIKAICDDLLSKLKEKPDIFLPAVQTFSKKYQAFKTDANLVSSLHCFGRNINESSTSASVYAVKRRGKKIHVQPTAISRRRILQLGKGSSSSANIGRPRKPEALREHKYAAYRRLNRAPHNLAHCVSNNISSGR